MSLGKSSLLLGVCFAVSAGFSWGASIVFSSAGASAANITPTVDSFRTALGTLNPNVAGSFGNGRREINWDGVPDTFSAPNNFPANFFNVNSPRGAVFSTPGTGFQVSGNAGAAPVRFDNINPGYSSSFITFSAQRLFTALGSPVTDVNFFLPGSTTASYVSAFGAVFTDVDQANVTSVQFFDTTNASLGTFFVPTAPSGLSFLGVQFNAGEQVSRVRIINGNSALGPNEVGTTDLVVMDDFLYAEPAAVPEPSTVLTLGIGIGIFVTACRLKRLQSS